MSEYFNRGTTRTEYERMRRIARFWAVYRANEDRWPNEPEFCSEFWCLFARPVSPEPLRDRLNDYLNAKEIPY